MLLLESDAPYILAFTAGSGFAFGAAVLVSGLAVCRVLVRVELRNTQREHADGEEFKGVLGGGAVGDFREDGVFAAGFFVGGGLKGADCSFDCW